MNEAEIVRGKDMYGGESGRWVTSSPTNVSGARLVRWSFLPDLAKCGKAIALPRPPATAARWPLRSLPRWTTNRGPALRQRLIHKGRRRVTAQR